MSSVSRPHSQDSSHPMSRAALELTASVDGDRTRKTTIVIVSPVTRDR